MSIISEDPIQTCCSPVQLASLDRNLALPTQLFSRCPACLQNFIAVFCHMTCDTKQDQFVYGKESEKQTGGKMSWKEINYYMSLDFANDTYNSCLNVQNPATGGTALEITCGRSIEECTPQNWLTYMGDPNQNPKAPFKINFKLSNNTHVHDDNKTFTPMDAETVPCNESCSCQDCNAACMGTTPPCPQPTVFEIIMIDGMTFIAAAIFGAFLILFGIWQVWVYVCCPPEDDDDYSEVTHTGDEHVSELGGDKNYTQQINPSDIKCCEKVSLFRLFSNGIMVL